mgnify:CR=1 FL=1|tara:strand:- start:89 stop:289 length:201 start_codon:yes stop_codon:yes gene_type:complete
MKYSIIVKDDKQIDKAIALLTKAKWLTETNMHLDYTDGITSFVTTSAEAHDSACFYLSTMGIKIIR